ncbi:MAG: Capsular polysaccharide biosynthesis protein [Solirubrobacterales bacterium]|nr:Capsular polysaccharide biosynthesis protein [Solirubrobacterales bacterium]
MPARPKGPRPLLLAAIVVVMTLLTVAVAVVFATSRERQYEAAAQVLVSPVSPDDAAFIGVQVLRAGSEPGRAVQTAIGILDNEKAYANAARSLGGGRVAADVRDDIRVEGAGASSLVLVKGRDEDAAQAARTATEYAKAALNVRRRALADQMTAAVRRTQLSLALADDPSSDYADVLRARLDVLRAARSARDPTLSLVQAAPVPTDRSGLGTTLVLLAALVAGLALGIAVAMLASAALTPARPLAEPASPAVRAA